MRRVGLLVLQQEFGKPVDVTGHLGDDGAVDELYDLQEDPDELVNLAADGGAADKVKQMRKVMGLDHSVPVQFFRYLGQLIQGDLGYSWHSGNPVAKELITRFPATFELTTLSLLLMILFGLLFYSRDRTRWKKPLAYAWFIGLFTMGLLMTGGILGLKPVESTQWGGLPLTLLLSVFGLTVAYLWGLSWH
jgi:ABC-type dipeptide/oligopeptide/nickel transport system permease component